MSFSHAGPDIPDWFCPFKIPPEFSGSIPPLVFLAGLDVDKNPIHKGIWEMIKLKPSTKDFQPTYVDVPLDHKFPVKKPRLENIETHIPPGILKANWLNKHLQLVPSVVVMFFDLNWTDPYWNDKKNECAKRVRDLKSELNPHGSQILVMLIKTADAGEDNFSTDRASALCAAADIPPKALYILAHTHSERIQACVQRLEVGMKEASKIYYTGRIRRVKNWKDRTVDLVMLARYNFKTAFFQEIRRDYVSALSHYHAAFEMVKSIKSVEALIQQIRCVSAWITYRICRLNLLKLDFKEAEINFDKHIRTFNKLEGHCDLNFEQYAWLQQQYTYFGELLRHFYRPGYTTLDPVTYFLFAVHYSDKRAQLARHVRTVQGNLKWPPEMDEYLNCDIQYVGQRPWRPEAYSADAQFIPEDPKAISALTFFEQRCKHSEDKITNLGVASDFCRDQQRLRTRCQLTSSETLINAIQCFGLAHTRKTPIQPTNLVGCFLLVMMMGIEFFAEKEYHRSVMLMTHVIREFGRDKGTVLLFLVAECGLMAACCDGDVAAYSSFLVFLLKKDFNNLVSSQRRNDLWSKLQAVLNKEIPNPEVGCTLNEEKWKSALETPYISYVGVHRECIINANFYFASDVFRAASPAEVCVVLQNEAEFPISISKCGAGISMSEYNCETLLDVTLEAGETKELSLFFTPAIKDVGKIIQVHLGYVDIGKPNASVMLHYSAIMGLSPYLWIEGKKEKAKQIIAKIDPMMPLLRPTVSREDPMLVNEWHKVHVTWTNTDCHTYTKINLTFLAAASDPSDIILCTDPNKAGKFGGLTHSIDVETLGPNESIDTVVYIKCMNPRRNELQFITKAKYMDNHRQSVMNELVDPVEVIKPFEITQRVLNLQTDNSGNVLSLESFMIYLTVKNISKCVLNLERLQVTKTLSSVEMVCDSPIEFIKSTMQDQEVVRTVNTFVQLAPTELPIGKLEITWRREKEDVPPCTSEISINPISMTQTAAIYVEGIFNCKGSGELKKPMQIKYSIHNRSDKVHDLWISLDSTECFMNAGPKKTNVKITAYESLDMHYVLFPLKTGLLKTPKLVIDGISNPGEGEGGGDIPSVIHKNVARNIFVTRAENQLPEGPTTT